MNFNDILFPLDPSMANVWSGIHELFGKNLRATVFKTHNVSLHLQPECIGFIKSV